MIEVPMAELVIPNDSGRLYRDAVIEFKHTKKNLDPGSRIEAEKGLDRMKVAMQTGPKYALTAGLYKLLERPSVLLFDDIEGELEERALFLAEHLLVKGRSHGASVIWITHSPSDYRKTRLLHRECQAYIMYASTAERDRTFLMDKYLKLNKK